MTSEESTPPAGLSGRKVTFWLLIGFAVCGIWIAYTLSSYSRIDQARKDRSTNWRKVSELLDARYRKIELDLSRAVDAGEIPIESGERFRLAIDEFRTTAQPERQYRAASATEKSLQSLRDQLTLPALNDSLGAALDQHNQLTDLLQQRLDSVGGSFLAIFLQFDEPFPLQLAEKSE